MKRSSDLLVSNLISAVMSPCGAVVGWCKWAARGGRGWKKSFTISTLPNSHTLQCKDWEIMWQSRHITPPPSPPTHPLTPSHTHTRRSNTHIKSFCNREKCCDSFSDCKEKKKKNCAASKHTANVISLEPRRKQRHCKSKQVSLCVSLPWVVPLPGPSPPPLAAAAGSHVSGPHGTGADHLPAFTQCWCSGGLSPGRQGSSQV